MNFGHLMFVILLSQEVSSDILELFLPPEALRVGPRHSQPLCTVERSRNQVLLRSGFKGVGQNKALGYGAAAKYKTEAEALAVGKAWVQAERHRQGVL